MNAITKYKRNMTQIGGLITSISSISNVQILFISFKKFDMAPVIKVIFIPVSKKNMNCPNAIGSNIPVTNTTGIFAKKDVMENVLN